MKRTGHRMECKTETYDTFRCERVAVVKDVTVCVTKRVPTWETRKVCVKETVWEDRVVNKTSYKYVQETCMKKQLVRLGHWECREVSGIFGGNGGGLFGGHGHGHHGCCDKGCADPCKASNACNDNCRPARTRKVWVSCPEYKQCPHTVCKKVCVTEAVKCKVAVCKNVWKEEKVCVHKCVTEKVVQKCTVYENRKVACKATRQVRVCVPFEETVNCCKWVQKTVTRQVPASNACSNASTKSCSNDCCERRGLLAGLRDRFARNDCCETRTRNCGHHHRTGCCN
ncbi:MAG: hypothetical protein HY289_04755 [Planctomycetes bacterium]|nr:hypothetical protein [Planctomycetota bacterium]